MRRTVLAISIPLMLACAYAAHPSFAQTKNEKKSSGQPWNSSLTDMMNNLEAEVGTGKGPPSSGPEFPPATPKELPTPSPSVAEDEVEPSKKRDTADDITKNSEGSVTDLASIIKDDNYLKAIAGDGLARWNKQTMPVKVFIQKTSNLPDFRPSFPKILQNAFVEWQEAAPDLITISFVDKSDQAQIVCTWTNDKSEMLNPREGGNTYIVPDANGIVQAEMKILAVTPSGMNTITDAYMKHVTLHEAGHALGIIGHSSNSADIMYYEIMPNEAPRDLTPRDKATMQALYKANDKTIAAHRLDPRKKELETETTNPKVMAFKLNNEAARDLDSKNFQGALKKLEQAHKLDPSNKLVQANLGAIYANFGSVAGVTYNFALAGSYFKKAIPLLEVGGNKPALRQVLQNYINILKLTKANKVEIETMERKLSALSG